MLHVLDLTLHCNSPSFLSGRKSFSYSEFAAHVSAKGSFQSGWACLHMFGLFFLYFFHEDTNNWSWPWQWVQISILDPVSQENTDTYQSQWCYGLVNSMPLQFYLDWIKSSILPYQPYQRDGWDTIHKNPIRIMYGRFFKLYQCYDEVCS